MNQPVNRPSNSSAKLVKAARELCLAVESLRFAPPVRHVYNPLRYAFRPHEIYLTRYGRGLKRVTFLGMNPGPFGMAQTGVPFGEVRAVREWLGIMAPVDPFPEAHPCRPVLGFACERSEVSGQRLWGLFAQRFGSPDRFFQEHFVVNYCPLAFVEESGRNRTPDKLPALESGPLFNACDQHFRRTLEALRPEWVIGIGAFAVERARTICQGLPVRIGQVLHPSPASPAANRDWAGVVTRQLEGLGVW